jgi:hypothetical protein
VDRRSAAVHREIYNAEDADKARAAITAFEQDYDAKFPKAVAKIVDDADVLLEFYKYPADYWVHLRTTKLIESAFATVRLRPKVTKGPGSCAAGLAMAYNLIEAVQTRWRAVNAPHLVALVRSGAVFHKGKLLGRTVDITPTETDKSPETEVATPTDGQPEARAHGGHRRPHVRAALGGELDQPGGESTRRRPGCDALQDPGEHEREDPAGRPEDRRPGRGQQKDATSTGRRPRWSLSDPTVSRAPTNPATYTAKTTVRIVTEKPHRCRYSG